MEELLDTSIITVDTLVDENDGDLSAEDISLTERMVSASRITSPSLIASFQVMVATAS